MPPCNNCLAPSKSLWVMFGPHRKPVIQRVQNGNWVSLERCNQCGALWCNSPYEPYASFPYMVAWSQTPEEWKRLHDSDDGQALLAWHAYMINRDWSSLPTDELAEVASHRKRSYGHNPIDAPGSFKAAALP